MNKLWNRQKVEADASALFDAAKETPQIVVDDDGHFILHFEPGAKRSIAEWAVLPGTLEDGDEL